MEQSDNVLFISNIKSLITKKKVTMNINVEIFDILEIEYEEYSLTLKIDNYLYKGIYMKKNEKIKKGEIAINYSFFLSNSNYKKKIFICIFETVTKEEYKNISNNNNKDEQKNLITTIIDLEPDNLIKIISEKFTTQIKYLENVFLVLEVNEKEYKIISIINLESFVIEKKIIEEYNIVKNDFIYCKNYYLNGNIINCNNLSIIRKAQDCDIFYTLEKLMGYKNQSYFHLLSIIDNDIKEFSVPCLFAKVILYNIKKKDIKIIDNCNRIIKLDYNIFKNLELFDLMFITNANLRKSNDDEYMYELTLSNNSFFYSTNKLYFDKNISINNYSILDIKFPDYKEGNNHYNKIRISDTQLKILKNRIICVFLFNNEKFNEVVQFEIFLICNNKEDSFKFFIVNNLLNKINVFLSECNNNCCIEYCFKNRYEETPESFSFKRENTEYKISHCNSFNTVHRIGFILINIPSNEQIEKIKKNLKKESSNIISAQIWMSSIKDKNEEKYHYAIEQIFNIDETSINIYSQYNLEIGNFDNLYEVFLEFIKNWRTSKENALNYFKLIKEKNKEYINEINSLIFKDVNVEYNSDNINYPSFKKYINILLFASLNKINEKYGDSSTIFRKWFYFFSKLNNIIIQLFSLKNKLNYHQKIRIINKFTNYCLDKEVELICKFVYIDESLPEDNAYYLAFNFNINIIKSLTEKSALTEGFLQLDGYILKNYNLENIELTYTLSNEPLITMKQHLLSNYENFIFIIQEEPVNGYDIKASQDPRNRITSINERSLFKKNDSIDLYGKNNALPITIEFFHENSHSKKHLKNKYINSPKICSINNKVQKLKDAEDGKFIESLIGDSNFISQLKNPRNNLGELMKMEYFIDENFYKLHSKYKELLPTTILIEKKSEGKANNLYDHDFEELPEIDNTKKYEDKKGEKNLEYYENKYLFDGTFNYPDSLPYDSLFVKDNEDICEGQRQYLEKYAEIIQKAKLLHYENNIIIKKKKNNLP